MVKKKEEVKKFENTSENPLCQMYLVEESNMGLLRRHMVNFEQAMYDYYQKFKGYPLWYVKCSLVSVKALTPTEFRMYNNYIEECKKQQENTDFELYAVQLEFDVDSSG